MRKIIICILAAAAMMCTILPSYASAANKKTRNTKKEVTTLAKKFQNEPGFDAFNIGPMMMSLAKAAIKLEDGDSVSEVMDAMEELKGISLISLEACSPETRDAFNKGLKAIMDSSHELLMEMKDKADIIKIYGNMDSGGELVHDLILYDEKAASVICLWGGIKPEAVASLCEAD